MSSKQSMNESCDMALFTMLFMLIEEKFYYWVIKHGMIKGVVHQIRPSTRGPSSVGSE